MKLPNTRNCPTLPPRPTLIEILPEKIPVSCLDDQVHLKSCKKYFTQDGWLAVQNVVEAVRKSPTYYCGRCTFPIDDETEDSVFSVTAA